MSAKAIVDLESKQELEAMADRWDREWIQYFRRAPDYFVDTSRPNDDVILRINRVSEALAKIDPAQAGRGSITTKDNPVWDIWAIALAPSEIVGARVADLGCGPGGIGRTLSYLTEHFLGIDFARLPLHVARIISPSACTYLSRFQTDEIASYFGTRDAVFSRNVFIHQNYEQARRLASLGSMLLRPGGLMAIDFFDPSHKDVTDPTQRGLSRLAKDELDPDRPTVGYFFTNEEIHDLASECDLSVEDIIQAPKWNWRIVRFRKA